MLRKSVWISLTLALAMIIIGCGGFDQEPAASLTPIQIDRPNQTSAAPVLPRPENRVIDQEYVWDQRLDRDAIQPIYAPTFLPAAEAPYRDDELVIGVALNGEAKAYAIGPLNGREMVNDTLGGVPILVTW